MAIEKNNIQLKIPEPSLRRLPWYLALAKLLKQKGMTVVSSTQIAKELSIDSSLVAKDLSYVNISGKTRVGYDVEAIIDVLEVFLGFSQHHEAFLFGIGSLGAALLQDGGLKQYGLEIIAGFDVRKEIIGKTINDIPIYHINQLAEIQAKTGTSIGILTVPVDKAQEVSNAAIAGNMKALWNFTPFRIKVPKNIVIQNTSLYAHLAVMFNRLNVLELEEENNR